jgi:acetyl-CoA acetyltransferase
MAAIVGVGMTRMGRQGLSATQLMQNALEAALGDARIPLRDVSGLIAVPSLSESRFMHAHFLATRVGLLPQTHVLVRTIDTGGAGPVSGLLEAARMVETGVADVAVVVAGDAVSSLSTDEFLRRADAACKNPDDPQEASPVIPCGYNRVAEWQARTYGVTREQLAMCAVLMSEQAHHHPASLNYGKTPVTLQQVLASPRVASMTNLFECARRTDGGAACVLASDSYLKRHGLQKKEAVRVVSGAEASGPIYPPAIIDETMFSCEEAMAVAYAKAGLSTRDIDFFGLYDCFPVCLLRSIEACGLAPRGEGGAFVERVYNDYVEHKRIDPKLFPVNTHGGLLAHGAPWETPAFYNILEAYRHLTNSAGSRQIPNARRALVYGNGGIFSASAVAILSRQ